MFTKRQKYFHSDFHVAFSRSARQNGEECPTTKLLGRLPKSCSRFKVLPKTPVCFTFVLIYFCFPRIPQGNEIKPCIIIY